LWGFGGGLTTRHCKKYLVKKPKQKSRDRVMDNEHWNRTGQHGLRIGNWNVRTLYKAGALQTLTEVVEKYNVHLVALQETRWPEEGSVTSGNMVFMYGGNM